eukprot:SAG31_NODE_24703_length_476_cov_0.546419_2_plen_23_part_01
MADNYSVVSYIQLRGKPVHGNVH